MENLKINNGELKVVGLYNLTFDVSFVGVKIETTNQELLNMDITLLMLDQTIQEVAKKYILDNLALDIMYTYWLGSPESGMLEDDLEELIENDSPENRKKFFELFNGEIQSMIDFQFDPENIEYEEVNWEIKMVGA